MVKGRQNNKRIKNDEWNDIWITSKKKEEKKPEQQIRETKRDRQI